MVLNTEFDQIFAYAIEPAMSSHSSMGGHFVIPQNDILVIYDQLILVGLTSLWVYSHYKYFNYFSAGIDVRLYTSDAGLKSVLR